MSKKKEPAGYKAGRGGSSGGKSLWVDVDPSKLVEIWPMRRFELNYNRFTIQTPDGRFPFGFNLNFGKDKWACTLSRKDSCNQGIIYVLLKLYI